MSQRRALNCRPGDEQGGPRQGPPRHQDRHLGQARQQGRDARVQPSVTRMPSPSRQATIACSTPRARTSATSRSKKSL